MKVSWTFSLMYIYILIHSSPATSVTSYMSTFSHYQTWLTWNTGASWQNIFGFVQSLFLSLWLYSPLDLGRFFSFLILYRVGRTLWMEDQPIARLLPTHRINKHRHPCLKWDLNPWPQSSSGWQWYTCLRPCGYCVWLLCSLATLNLHKSLYMLWGT